MVHVGKSIRQRACGVVLRDDEILLVRHVHDGRDYWTLPGGGIDHGESVFEAAEREVLEETNLHVRAMTLLCCYEASHSRSQCVLMSTPAATAQPVLGIDPEDAHLPDHEKMLQAVAFLKISDHIDLPMVRQVIAEIDNLGVSRG